MPLTPVDRDLLQRCLRRERGSWNDFVDRYLGLVYHTIHHTAYLRSVPLQPEDVEDAAAEVLLEIIADDYAALRQFRGQASLATYLTVIARRVAVHSLNKRAARPERQTRDGRADRIDNRKLPGGLESVEEVAKFIKRLPTRERRVVRLFYLEGRSYEEISTALHLPVNSIGPVLSRARKMLRYVARKADPKRRGSAGTKEE